MALYYKLMAMLMFLLGWIGFLGPYCISLAFTPIVIGYILLSIILSPLYIMLIVSTVKEFINKQFKKETK